MFEYYYNNTNLIGIQNIKCSTCMFNMFLITKNKLLFYVLGI